MLISGAANAICFMNQGVVNIRWIILHNEGWSTDKKYKLKKGRNR